MRVILAGQFHDAAGYGNAARNYLRAFDKNNIRDKIDFYILSVSFEKHEKSILSEEEIELVKKYHLTEEQINSNKDSLLISFHTPNIPYFFGIESKYNPNMYKIIKTSKKIINMVVWETNKVPNNWIEWINKTIIVPCKWNYDTFEKDTKSKIYLVPYPIDKQNNKQYKKTNTFNILSISQWNNRKGFDTLIKAYASEFFDQEDVCLTIKTYRNEIFNPNKIQEKEIIITEASAYKSSVSSYGNKSKAKIKIISDILSKEDIIKLYDDATVFSLATKGEGFGLTIAEAASKGLPCIVPNKGGHIDFLDKESNFLYESKYSTVIDCHAVHYSSIDMKYIESDFEDLRYNLRKAYNIWKYEEDKFTKMSENTKKFIDLYLDDVKITDNFINIVKELHE